ncbi:hypothetical protein ACQPWY_15685 [Pseudonocardia xinjiangensis]|uniref:hypothetical protein n=1 Tax=Pseudonocardia xinjiangensis TaxID=75289 RepID=UPI003D9073B7
MVDPPSSASSGPGRAVAIRLGSPVYVTVDRGEQRHACAVVVAGLSRGPGEPEGAPPRTVRRVRGGGPLLVGLGCGY